MAQNYLRIPSFRRTLRGYDPEQVDAFAKAVQDRYNSVSAENEKLKDRLNALLNEGKKRGVEEEMRRSEIEEIRDEAERLLESARMRADKLVSDAKSEAERIRREAENESEELLDDTRAYTEEARREALSLVKERDAALARAETAVARLRLTLGEEYERVVRLLDGVGDELKENGALAEAPAAEEKAGPEPEEPVYGEPDVTEEPEWAGPEAEDGPGPEEEPEEPAIEEEPLPEEEPVYGEPDITEEPEWAGPEAEDGPGPEEEPEEPAIEDEPLPEEEPVYGEPDVTEEPEWAGPEAEDGPGPEEEPEEPAIEEEPLPEEEPVSEETACDGAYRDYDLDEILKGLSFMTSEKADEPSESDGPLPEKDEDIVDALKKKFGEPADEPAGRPAEEENEGETVDPDDLDFYDEEHEDGEEFDPNDYTRFFK